MFDAVIVIDWSAASRPRRGRDSIWIAVHEAGGLTSVTNPATRSAAMTALRREIVERPHQRLVVAIDVALGFPAGFAAALRSTSWRDVWATIASLTVDDADNGNNRFSVADELNARVRAGSDRAMPGPFWGCPPRHATDRLTTTRPFTFPVTTPRACLGEFRIVEHRMIEAGFRPASSWQTFYAGSVGGQSLTAIAAIERLRHDDVVGQRVIVWPFEHGGDDDSVVVAECWPTWFGPDLSLHPIRDAAQVVHTARCLSDLDRRGDLAALLAPRLDVAELVVVGGEEGWVLGVA